ncbi:DNA-binding transcriptional regulator, MerR family [Micrococcales bacterium KH10]|nr:DNA-binding transcriptional regulator, MerR family [Micrococcales bacterium KH10]
MTSYEGGLRAVGEVSDLLGLSVRTLHHWEERGLIAAAGRSWSNYRLYSDADINRLQQIMIYRATGMSLQGIAELLESDDDPITRLRRQRDLLVQKETELHRMVRAIDELLGCAMSNKPLNLEEVAEILGDADFPAHQAEAEETWGDTDDWTLSQQATSGMSKADWQDLREKTNELEQTLAEAMQRGVEPGSDEANALAEAHRQMYSAFFPVSHSKQVLMACNYVADPRFTAHYDKRGAGSGQRIR